ncbi:unnamed protein product [Adineta ricciae]|uniref:Uncharacterized protein n=1 Tax=Adineta ricciae TaxID=249248 RepID=A0A814H8B2_ADIRI|nr:unnamed protein product [Adineta ricciae]CAF1444900.1 unnamed protein product [Adineta ricciae]
MHGNLFIYDEKYKLVAFESSLRLSSRCFIFLGGLTDGLLSLPYISRLNQCLSQLSYSLIQPLFRSSNLQYGWHTIDHDIEDLQSLIDFLIKQRTNLESIILMGHSTGCQDIIHYLRQGNKHSFLHGIILQGPVSDRQYLSTLSSTQKQLEYCEQNRENIHEWLPRCLHDPPITIERCLSLNQINSIEDLFSSDLSDEQLSKIYQQIDVPNMWIWSRKDEYVPDQIREEAESFVKDKLATKNNSKFVLLEQSDHSVTNEQEQIHMIENIVQFIRSIH